MSAPTIIYKNSLLIDNIWQPIIKILLCKREAKGGGGSIAVSGLIVVDSDFWKTRSSDAVASVN